jgi:hypothetical protein
VNVCWAQYFPFSTSVLQSGFLHLLFMVCICVRQKPKAQSEEGFDLLDEHNVPLVFPSKHRVVAA